MKIAVASDHAGIDLKLPMLEVLKERGIEFTDFGTHDHNSTDYPSWGELVGKKVASGEYEKGLLFCGTGIGISLAANSVKGIRAVVCSDVFSAKMSREHNNCNILSLGARVVGVGLAAEILNAWLDTDFEDGGRHQRRVDMLIDIQDENMK
ncbi:MAG: ribose 5-phosphate isomerase B [Candidatus Ancillula sp.]|jgi:ribose 5-phosphate isomerase B|nr:ribose 5-phosphate isomerase B [Candidatus Ancillula sp.]